MPKAVIVGGSGQIGIAVSKRLLENAWDVTVVSRHAVPLPSGLFQAYADARDTSALTKIIGADTDLLLSCVAFDTVDAECLAQAGRAAGHIAVISSVSVYCDDWGRTLDEASVGGFPVFPVPLTELSSTVAPGSATYSTRKVAMEQTLQELTQCPITILRPCAIYGPFSKHAREWWFVKRLLDGRTAIPLAYRGRSRFQTTSVAAIADAVLEGFAGKLPPITNVSDANCPTVEEIGHAIMGVMGVRAELVGLPDTRSYPPKFGRTPWSVARPMVCAAAATARKTYAESVESTVRWLLDHVENDNWQSWLPQLAMYPYDHFDYELDEQALRLKIAELE